MLRISKMTLDSLRNEMSVVALTNYVIVPSRTKKKHHPSQAVHVVDMEQNCQ